MQNITAKFEQDHHPSTGATNAKDPTNSVKALKEEKS